MGMNALGRDARGQPPCLARGPPFRSPPILTAVFSAVVRHTGRKTVEPFKEAERAIMRNSFAPTRNAESFVPRSAGLRRRSRWFILALPILAVTSKEVRADAPPQLSKLTIIGQNAERQVQAGQPLRFRLGGTGKCAVEIQIVEVGANRALTTQSFPDVALGSSPELATTFLLPPMGVAGRAPLEKDLTVTALPKLPCKGIPQAAIIHSVCRGTCGPSSASNDPKGRPHLTIDRLRLPPTPTSPAPTSPAPTSTTKPPSPTPSSTAPKPPSSPTSSSTPPTPPTPPAPNLPSAKPATGALTTMTVPGGSFAEDEAQKLALVGTGGCGLDLHITNKSYGGSFDKSWNVNPVNLANKPTLYNGTHFDTLAEGSYHADATGKNGCGGTVAVDFKVTPKSTNDSVKGKPTLTLDKKPKSGDAFSRTKDSNIWFKVQVPSNFKDVPYISCCEVEYDYLNQYGGWEVIPSGVFTDQGLNPLANGNQAAFRSVSYFTIPNEGALKWRMRVRGFKFKTAFEWSDWLEFQVDQN